MVVNISVEVVRSILVVKLTRNLRWWSSLLVTSTVGLVELVETP